MRQRARLMATKAPKDAPWLLIGVLILGIILLLLYGLASQLDMGMVSW
jgi:hypothetical protein